MRGVGGEVEDEEKVEAEVREGAEAGLLGFVLVLQGGEMWCWGQLGG